MSIIVFALVILILRANCSNLFGTLNEIEFPPSWHFFESHNGLENYKYGFFMQTRLDLKGKSKHNQGLFSNIMSYDIESNYLEVDEDIFSLLSNPILLVENKPRSEKTKELHKVVFFCPDKTGLAMGKGKQRVLIQMLRLKLKNGGLLKLLLNFSKIGLWIWESKTIENYKLNMNKSHCYAVGSKDKVRMLQKSLHSKIKVSELQVDVPFFKSKVLSKSLYKFITENKIDGIVGLNDNSIQGVGVFETISKMIDPSEGKYFMSFECRKPGNPSQSNKIQDSLLFAVLYGNTKAFSENEKGNSTGKNGSIVKVLIDGETKLKFNAKLILNLNIFGAVVPEIRLLQLFAVLMKSAIQKGHNCGIKNTVLGRAIFCDCEFLNSNLGLKLSDKANSFSIHLNNFVAKDANYQQQCLVEIYGIKRTGIKFEESWIFGQVLCNADNINKFSKTNNSSWKIGTPQLIKIHYV